MTPPTPASIMKLIIQIEVKKQDRVEMSCKLAAGSITDNPGNMEYVDTESCHQAASVAWLTELTKVMEKTVGEFHSTKPPSTFFSNERNSG